MTVLFADLVGFTALSEVLDPEDVAAVQDAYFAGVRDVVARRGGRLAMELLGDRTAEMEPPLREADRVATTRDLLQLQAWVQAGRSEAAFLVGDWDDAVRHGRAALAIALAHGYLRAAIKTWFVLRPIALHRGDGTMLRELGDWLATLDALPDSPYGRLMGAALDHSVAAGTGADPVIPDAEQLRDCWALAYDDPSLIAARDAVLAAWWEDGRYDDVLAALDAMPLDGSGPGPLAQGSIRLWRARLGGDETEIVEQARGALEQLRRWDAGWWIEQAIGVLDDAGDATPAEREERRAIRIRLMGEPTS